MVDLVYPGIFTDDFGCDKAKLYVIEDRLCLQVRKYKFYSDNLDFDFIINESDKDSQIEKIFKLKDNELIDYILDIRIPWLLDLDRSHRWEEVILRIERQKNYYDVSLNISSMLGLSKIENLDVRNILFDVKNYLLNKEGADSNYKYRSIYC